MSIQLVEKFFDGSIYPGVDKRRHRYSLSCKKQVPLAGRISNLFDRGNSRKWVKWDQFSPRVTPLFSKTYRFWGFFA